MTIEIHDDLRRKPLDEPPMPSQEAPAETANDAHDHDDHEHGFEWQDATRIAFVAVAAAAVWFEIWEPLKSFSLIGVIGLLVGGWPILKEALENIFARRMTMELSMTIAIARQTRRIIWQNFTGTIAVDTIGIVLARFGFLNPLLAAFIHVTSELIFILNSARLLSGANSNPRSVLACPQLQLG